MRSSLSPPRVFFCLFLRRALNSGLLQPLEEPVFGIFHDIVSGVRMVPLWGDILLIVMLECGLCAVWFGEQVACWRDTKLLNRNLKKFQGEG